MHSGESAGNADEPKMMAHAVGWQLNFFNSKELDLNKTAGWATVVLATTVKKDW